MSECFTLLGDDGADPGPRLDEDSELLRILRADTKTRLISFGVDGLRHLCLATMAGCSALVAFILGGPLSMQVGLSTVGESSLQGVRAVHLPALQTAFDLALYCAPEEQVYGTEEDPRPFSRDTHRGLRKLVRTIFPEVERARRQIATVARRKGYVASALGRRIKVGEGKGRTDFSITWSATEATRVECHRAGLVEVIEFLENGKGGSGKVVAVFPDGLVVEAHRGLATLLAPELAQAFKRGVKRVLGPDSICPVWARVGERPWSSSS